jgi:hypothetical protein
MRPAPCHDAGVLPYPAYLRVYEPLHAFAEPDRSAWARYADSDDRPSRAAALTEEHTAALHRLVAVPPVVAPARESGHAFVRRTADTTFICPWQVRLRSWLAFSRFRAALPPGVANSFVPGAVADLVEADFERWKQRSPGLRPYILSSNWHVPLAWFAAFEPGERCLNLGPRTAGPVSDNAPPGGQSEQVNQPEPGGGIPITAVPARTLIYVTSMAQARRRVAKAVRSIRNAGIGDAFEVGDVATLGRWLEEFHPHALVELDYGGLVHLVDDTALRADESAAEVAAVLDGMQRDRAVALAMYERVQARWRSVRALENAN